jgi:hypothetical protein
MQSAIVIVIALSGIGCHNKCSDVSNSAPACNTIGGIDANSYPSFHAPSSYCGWHSMSESGYDSSHAGHQGAWRSTIWSFVLGRDPDVATAREIEESVFGRSPGH